MIVVRTAGTESDIPDIEDLIQSPEGFQPKLYQAWKWLQVRRNEYAKEAARQTITRRSDEP
jgi:hypothetical protein